MTEAKKVELRFSDYPSLLEEIRKRPQMYLGGKKRNLARLLTYLGGFELAEDFYGLPETKRMGGFDWEAFENWVEKKYNPKRLSCYSMSLAIYRSKSKAAAFDLWFSWYDEYRALNSD